MGDSNVLQLRSVKTLYLLKSIRKAKILVHLPHSDRAGYFWVSHKSPALYFLDESATAPLQGKFLPLELELTSSIPHVREKYLSQTLAVAGYRRCQILFPLVVHVGYEKFVCDSCRRYPAQRSAFAALPSGARA